MLNSNHNNDSNNEEEKGEGGSSIPFPSQPRLAVSSVGVGVPRLGVRRIRPRATPQLDPHVAKKKHESQRDEAASSNRRRGAGGGVFFASRLGGHPDRRRPAHSPKPRRTQETQQDDAQTGIVTCFSRGGGGEGNDGWITEDEAEPVEWIARAQTRTLDEAQVMRLFFHAFVALVSLLASRTLDVNLTLPDRRPALLLPPQPADLPQPSHPRGHRWPVTRRIYRILCQRLPVGFALLLVLQLRHLPKPSPTNADAVETWAPSAPVETLASLEELCGYEVELNAVHRPHCHHLRHRLTHPV